MPRRSPLNTPWSSPLPLTALSVGLWENDVDAGLTRGDAVWAQIFGTSVAEAEDGITWARFLSILHPEDLEQQRERKPRERQDGGLFVWEHRIIPAPGIVRWVLSRGQFERDKSGRMIGRGILIDVTDSRSDGHTSGPSRYLTPLKDLGPTLECMAEYALNILDMGRDLDVEKMNRIRPLLNALLHEFGCQIAASLSSEPDPINKKLDSDNLH